MWSDDCVIHLPGLYPRAVEPAAAGRRGARSAVAPVRVRRLRCPLIPPCRQFARLSGPLFYRARPASASRLAPPPRQPRVPLAEAPASRRRRRFGRALPFRGNGALVFASAAPRVGTFRPRAVEPAAAGRREARSVLAPSGVRCLRCALIPPRRQLARLSGPLFCRSLTFEALQPADHRCCPQQLRPADGLRTRHRPDLPVRHK